MCMQHLMLTCYTSAVMFLCFRVVFPEMADNGGYIKPRLRSYCHGDDYRYNPIKDACEK